MSESGLEKNIGTLLERAAARYGEKAAIHFDHENVCLSFRQLNEKVNQFVRALQGQGVQKNDHVAVMLRNCPEFPLTWLALAKLGATMVPINFRYKATDLEYVLNDSDASALIISTEFAPIFREAWPKTPMIERIFRVGEGENDLGLPLAAMLKRAPADFISADPSLDDLINIQYTSGTTGFPKGCMLTHRYWLNIGSVMSRLMTEDDVFLCVTPFYYMDPQWELTTCLTAGSTMILAREYSATRYMNLVRKYKVTVSWALMPAWIYKQPESPLDKDHNLRFVLVDGIPPQLHKKFEERFNVIVREAYGMTEIGVGTIVPLDDDHMTGSGSVGKLAPVREARIVDLNGNAVAQGEEGELLIKGPGMLKGYYNKPKETAAAFDGEWFRTGDLFRQDAQGYYYIVGRKKDMIRRSGDNISASEVEDVLKSSPKILSAAVVPVPDEAVGEEVKAYIIPAEDETPESIPPQEIIEFCRDRIAEFKLPRFIEYKEKFPMTPTGRIQKTILLDEKKDLTAECFDRLKPNPAKPEPDC